jgi:hypothetical protein
MTFLALLFFLFLSNTGILGLMGLKTLSLSKDRNLLRATLHLQLAPDDAVRDFSPPELN